MTFLPEPDTRRMALAYLDQLPPDTVLEWMAYRYSDGWKLAAWGLYPNPFEVTHGL